MAYAARQRTLAQPQKDGKSYAWHLKAAAKRSPSARAELEAGPELPPGCAYVWTWFLELNGARTHTEMGPNPVTYGEIADWERLTRRRLQSGEVALLRALDQVWLMGPEQPEDASE